MEVDERTPRSGRKKKSALAKLAAQKNRRHTEDDVGSSASLNDSVIHGSSSPKINHYPIDANVEVCNHRPGYDDDREDGNDSDEGIGMTGSSNERDSTRARPNGRLPSQGTLDRLRHLNMDHEDGEDSDDENDQPQKTPSVDGIEHDFTDFGHKPKYRSRGSREQDLDDTDMGPTDMSIEDTDQLMLGPRPKFKGEKRFHEPNSSGEEQDVSHRTRARKFPSRPKVVIDSDDDVDSEKAFGSMSELRNEFDNTYPSRHNEERMDYNIRFSPKKSQDPHVISDSIKPAYSSQIHSSQDSGENSYRNKFGSRDLLDDYKNMLTERERYQKPSLDSTERAEMEDDLSALRQKDLPTWSSSPPTVHRHPTNISLRSSILGSMDRPWSAANKSAPQYDLMSDRSLQSTSALPQISTKEAKNRSFLHGSINGNSSLLGIDELQRLFPDRKVKIFVGTWNMCEMKDLPESLDDLMLPDTADYVQDMYVIGTQESCSNRREWEIKLQETLGPSHVLFHSAAHGVLYLTIFLRRDLIWFCSVSEEANVSTRAGPSNIKTKGAVAVCFTFFGSSFLFVNSHLTPHDGNVKQRISDYKKICAGLNIPKMVPSGSPVKSEDVTARFDCVFWMGDLNFRLEKERERVDNAVQGITTQDYPKFEDLMVHDELFRVRNEGLAFQEFQEGRISFKPTYKYDKNADTFDSSKKLRIPSYTDRILFRSKKKNAISCLHYDAVTSLKDSDHRPVYSMFEVNIRPGRDNIPLSAGQFSREVWLEGNRRRAMTTDVSVRSNKDSSVCSIQ